MNKERVFAILVMVMVLSVSATTIASAHRVHVRSEIGEIGVKAWFGGGEPMRDADVKVYAIKGGEEELYKEGKTDENGKFGFAPKIGVEEYKVVVESPGGHKGETVVNLTQAASPGDGTEMPLYTRVIAGFGYLIGLAGAAMAYMGWKQKKKKGEKT
ncbi:MAG: hypothetical protein WBD09_09355 [Halobacteriota archaeon]